jgi:hypothetical protein
LTALLLTNADAILASSAKFRSNFIKASIDEIGNLGSIPKAYDSSTKWLSVDWVFVEKLLHFLVAFRLYPELPTQIYNPICFLERRIRFVARQLRFAFYIVTVRTNIYNFEVFIFISILFFLFCFYFLPFLNMLYRKLIQTKNLI